MTGLTFRRARRGIGCRRDEVDSDTHAVLWAAEGDPRLGAEASARLAEMRTGEAVISDISLLEIAMLAAKGRIRIASPMSRYLAGIQERFPVLGVEPGIAAMAFDLNLENADPFDRVIVSTARHYSLPLATRDTAIRRSQLVTTIW